MLEFRMKNEGQTTSWVLVVLVVTATLGMLMSMAWRSYARAQDDVEEISTETLLVRAAVAEADFNPLDRAAIWHVLKRRADSKSISIEEMTRAYVSAFHAKKTERLGWVLSLEESCSEPAGWPAGSSWSGWEAKCLRAFKDAQAFLRGDLVDPCPSSTQWGSRTLPTDRARAARAVAAGKWIPARCATANQFFRER